MRWKIERHDCIGRGSQPYGHALCVTLFALIHTVKYVALLAFNKIAASHPDLVALQHDVILACIDDADISIRFLALQLGARMVNSQNLRIVVDRLMKQLQDAGASGEPVEQDIAPEMWAVRDGTDLNGTAEIVHPNSKDTLAPSQVLPADYRRAVVNHILEMCSRNGYSNVVDFKWYVDILIALTHVLPSSTSSTSRSRQNNEVCPGSSATAGTLVGNELQSIAVRVSSVRAYTAEAAMSLLQSILSSRVRASREMLDGLEYIVWIVGEFSYALPDVQETLDFLLLPMPMQSSTRLSCAYLQAIPKILALRLSQELRGWSSQTQTKMLLLLTRTAKFFEDFVESPNLEAQEISIGILELLRVAIQATESHSTLDQTSPLFLSEALPTLFRGSELKPVAASAQKKVPPPRDLELSQPLNGSLGDLLLQADEHGLPGAETLIMQDYYRTCSPAPATAAAINALHRYSGARGYQDTDNRAHDSLQTSQTGVEAVDRGRNSAFYINEKAQEPAGLPTPFQGGSKGFGGLDEEIASIPIMNLDIQDKQDARPNIGASLLKSSDGRHEVHVEAEETIEGDQSFSSHDPHQQFRGEGLHNIGARLNAQRPLLQVDSSGIGSLPLVADNQDVGGSHEAGNAGAEDVEMARALANVEKMRMEMQRASERVYIANDIPADGTLVKRKKKKKRSEPPMSASYRGQEEGETSVGAAGDAEHTKKMSAEAKNKKRRKKAKTPMDNSAT